ncbi:Ras association domain-containing protein 8 [Collichthys lucidus]|uniref:Ras association domain-containing protein 8 n=1 Tax=Collichthys lucidus TaxID=240159 RepID=A0A4U5UR83_COLLU|nr:Ras association domain-containing protein 8 [Collichthys lucidus]
MNLRVFFTFLTDFNVTTCEKQQNTNEMNGNQFQEHLHLYISSIKTDSGWCQITMFCLVLNITGIRLTGDYETFKRMCAFQNEYNTHFKVNGQMTQRLGVTVRVQNDYIYPNIVQLQCDERTKNLKNISSEQTGPSICTTDRTKRLSTMEVKVYVDGIPRVVCGVTAETTCQEVVIALAKALGRAGRYSLRETFKDFTRCMTPNEHLLETLEKYGEQAREVQLTLFHDGSSVLDEMSRTKVGRYQPCPPLRRKDAGTRMRRGSGSLSLHRQSLPPLSCLAQEAKQQKEDVKSPKRKVSDIYGGGPGMAGESGTACDKESSKRTDKRNRNSSNVSLIVDKDHSGGSSRSKIRGKKSLNSDLDRQTSCCMGSQTRVKETKHSKKTQEVKSDDLFSSSWATMEDEKNSLIETILCQLNCLQDLQAQIAWIDNQIFELEETQRAKKAEQEAQQRIAEEQIEQIQFWENELKAEEGHEKDLQRRFLEMKAKAMECKPKLEEYKRKLQGLDFFPSQNIVQDSEMVSKVGASSTTATTATGISAISTQDVKWQQSDPDGDVNINRKPPPREDLNPPHALVAPNQIKERRATGPTELREWWTRWSEARNSKSQTKQKVIHRSELTIYLGSTKV